MIQEFIKNNLGISPIVIEAGAAEGLDTLFFSNTFPMGTIYSFEPIKCMYEMALSRTVYRNNVVLTNAALSNVNQNMTMYVADRYGEPWGSHSLLRPKAHLINHPAITFKSEEIVKCIKLDDFVIQNNIPRIDFMWLDMQGHEPEMLASASHSLSMTQYIYTEVSTEELYKGTMLYPDYRNFLISKGFDVLYEDIPYIDGGNVLFGRQECY